MNTQNHDCVTKVLIEFKKNNSDIISANMGLTTVRYVVGGKFIGENRTGQRVTYDYEVKLTRGKRKGETVVKSGISFIGHKFCPFCGKEYYKLSAPVENNNPPIV